MPMQFADHAGLGGRLVVFRLCCFGRVDSWCCGGLSGHCSRSCCGWRCCCRRSRSGCGGRRLDIRWRCCRWSLRRCRCGRLLGRRLACIGRRQAQATRAAGIGLSGQQRHRCNQDQLAHGNPLYLVNPSYLTRVCKPLACEAVRADLDQGGPARQAIDQTEQLTQHDRTPLLIIDSDNRPRVFPTVFAPWGKWLRQGWSDVVGTGRTKSSSRGCETRARHSRETSAG